MKTTLATLAKKTDQCLPQPSSEMLHPAADWEQTQRPTARNKEGSDRYWKTALEVISPSNSFPWGLRNPEEKETVSGLKHL